MALYEFYWVDKGGEDHFFAILPERRKNPERITERIDYEVAEDGYKR